MPNQWWWLLINNPPSWLVAILVVIFVSHMAHKALHLSSSSRPASSLIQVLEVFLTVTLGFVVLHGLFSRLMGETKENSVDVLPLAIFASSVLFSAILYIVMYIVEKKIR
jgi:cytochrome bd-type quinol oxidase subunit 2